MKKDKIKKAIKVAICDDSSQERTAFYSFCKKIKEKYDLPIKTKEYFSGESLLFDMGDTKLMSTVDIVLLDINMPGTNGIDTAQSLKEMGYQGAIIFITHSNDLWRSAFDVRAFNYITKDSDIHERFEQVFIDAVKEAQERKGKALIFSSIDETRRIEVSTISHFEINNHLVTVYYGENQFFEFISSLSKVESLVISDGFLRVHRSFLISISHVEAFIPSKNKIKMMNGATVPVSRKYLVETRRVLEDEKNA